MPQEDARGGSPRFRAGDQPLLQMRMVIGGLAVAAVIGTIIYSVWEYGTWHLIGSLCVLVFYLPPPYAALYFLAASDASSKIALVDRICATLTAIGLLVFWGWYVTLPLTPQNAQAPIGLFMIGWTVAAGFYGTFKLLVYVRRWVRD